MLSVTQWCDLGSPLRPGWLGHTHHSTIMGLGGVVEFNSSQFNFPLS